METANHILLVRTPAQEAVDGRALRSYILESLALGVLVLTEDTSCEVMELPSLGGVVVTASGPEPEGKPPEEPDDGFDEGTEKRAILKRLKEYRDAHGLGCLAAVSAKTAHQKNRRLSDTTLRMVLTGEIKLPIEDWRKIACALDRLENQDEKGS